MDHTEAAAFAICAFRTYTSVFHPSLIFMAFMTHSMSFKSHASNIRQKRQRSPFALSANGTRPQPPTSLYVRSGSVRHLRFPHPHKYVSIITQFYGIYDSINVIRNSRVIYRYTSEGEVGGWGRDPKKCTGRDWGWGRVPFNEPYAPLLSTIYDGA